MTNTLEKMPFLYSVEKHMNYNEASFNYPHNKWAIKNYLKNHFGYGEDEAWDIYTYFSGDVTGGMERETPVEGSIFF